MDNIQDILRYDELLIFRLRALYEKFGYSNYKMSRFEEYELYAENKAFMPSGDILTFTGASGRLMALRPDVTLSIVKTSKDDGELKKLYYNENIYRSDGVEFKEQMQVGLECIGKIDVGLMGEVLVLAKKSLETVSEHSRLGISHMGFLSGLLQYESFSMMQKSEIIACISEKNTSGLRALCMEYGCSVEFSEKLAALSQIHGSFEDVACRLRELSINEEMNAAFVELEALHKVIQDRGTGPLSLCPADIYIDFSIVNDISYYSGIIFQGYIEGISAKVLSGGRYDELLRKFGKNAGAIGFAVYLDALSVEQRKQKDCSSASETKSINIALPKGRLGEKAYEIFEKAGYGCPEIKEESRKLVFENLETGIRYFWVKPSDVAIYVERGVADLGVAGKDILLEYSPDVYELLDLGIGKCNISVAVMGTVPLPDDKTDEPSPCLSVPLPDDKTDEPSPCLSVPLSDDKTDEPSPCLSGYLSPCPVRVATKFPNIARKHYRTQGREIDIIKLNGSIELAPLLGLSDVIVDIVETGQTLLENNMKPIEQIAEVSARLISNKASYTFKHEIIDKICEKIQHSKS
ncbi:MAG: ATP phosphoribosyltransferase [Oscillospiraceae bacterium]|nr:ATP phosphoribosyltransferase [Oscillospiraceae bacterium]